MKIEQPRHGNTWTIKGFVWWNSRFDNFQFGGIVWPIKRLFWTLSHPISRVKKWARFWNQLKIVHDFLILAVRWYHKGPPLERSILGYLPKSGRLAHFSSTFWIVFNKKLEILLLLSALKSPPAELNLANVGGAGSKCKNHLKERIDL